MHRLVEHVVIAAIWMVFVTSNMAQTTVADPACRNEFIAADGTYPFLRQTPLVEMVPSPIRIADIRYSRLAIFNENDPEESSGFYRLANRLHFLTSEQTLSQLLLVQPGELVEARLLDESGRLLREQDYLFDADLRVVSLCDSGATVEVITRDNWSLTPNLSFDRSGGDTSFAAGLREGNLLGMGKLLAISRGENLERQFTEIIYEDPNVLGSRVRNKTTFVDSNDGHQQLFELLLPFFALDSRRSWGVSINRETREDTQYRLGEPVSEVLHDLETGEILLGWSTGLIDDRVTRWSGGIRYRRDRFRAIERLPPPMHSPRSLRLTYPFVQIEVTENRFATAFNFDEILRTEDLYIGSRLVASMGYAGNDWGSEQQRIIINGEAGSTLHYDRDQLWQISLSWEGMLNLDSGHTEDALVSFSSRYFSRQSRRWSFLSSLRGNYSLNLSAERQLLMGSESGTRGYDTRFQSGDRRIVLTLEQRLHTNIHLFNMVRVGAAAFVDIGRAWETGVDSGLEDPWLANVGVGLRLASSRAASSRVIHFDLAVPVTNRGHPGVDALQIAFNVKSRF
ncbi:MAG: BamA/TamA family outer membrane protein [Gammaproteobacteria bacterium]|nr:BamA/TamA family outer membrane protein [Gammaproteobacteria bacterium]